MGSMDSFQTEHSRTGCKCGGWDELRRFARAEQAAARNEAGFVQALGAEHLLTRILRAELALAQKADAAPHLVSEVR